MIMAFYSCQKEKTDSIVDTVSLQQVTIDNNKVDAVMDESMNDVEYFLNESKSTLIFPCNATIDSIKTVGDTITKYITYNGLNCSQTKMRIGNVEIRRNINTHWYQQGSIVIIKHINFKVWKVSNPDKWIIINGEKTLQNVSGGLIIQVGDGVSVVHKVTGNVSVTFENNTTKNWTITRQKTFTGNFTQDSLMMTIDGFGTKDGYTNLAVWGVNRNGENFYSQINQSVVFKQFCDWNPCQGIRNITIPSDNKGATITYGYKDNLPIINGECPTQYKLDWYKGNKSGTIYLFL